METRLALVSLAAKIGSYTFNDPRASTSPRVKRAPSVADLSVSVKKNFVTDGGVNIGTDTEPKSFKFAENLWYCEDQPKKSAPQLPTVEKDGVNGKNPLFKDPAKGDFGVGPDSPAREIGAHVLSTKAK